MAYCPNCGKEVNENQDVCLNCGRSLNFAQKKLVVQEEGSTIGYAVLGFVMPVVGLVLFLIWLETKPKASRSAGIGALVGVISSVVLSIVMFILFMILMSLGYMSYENYYEFMIRMMTVII